MLYVIYGIDKPDSAALRREARPAHLERLRQLQRAGRLVLAGPMPRIDAPSLEAGVSGSLIVAEFDNLDAAQQWVDCDAYVEAGVYERVEVRPFISVDPQ